MAIDGPVATATPRAGFVHAIAGSSRRQTGIALVLYAVLSLEFFGVYALPHLATVCVCGSGPDPATYMWYLAWWPHALLHGLNPFFTDAVFSPYRLNLGAVTLIPGAAVLLAPVTLLFGPFVSYNLIVLASPTLAALFAFLLCRYVTGNFLASLAGGYLFGFSTYMLGHLLGHPNLVLTFPIPAAVHLVLRRLDGRIAQRRFIALLTLDLAALIAFSTELALMTVILGVLALALAVALVPSSRSSVRDIWKPTALAALIAALLTSPVIYYALTGSVSAIGFRGVGDWGGGDLLGLLVPTRVTALGGSWFSGTSSHFTAGNLAEGSIYLGIPLLALIAGGIITQWSRRVVRLLFALLIVVLVLLLGSHLHVGGHRTIVLPWAAIASLPLLRHATPVRLDVFVFLIAAVIAAMWLSSPVPRRLGVARWTLMAASIVFLFPNLSGGLWHTKPSNPRFFTTTQYRAYLHRGETVLALPWPNFTGFGMLWQADTGMWFRLAGGNLGKLFSTHYGHDPILPAFSDPLVTNEAKNLRLFLARHRVDAVVVDAGEPLQWPGVLAKLGLRPVSAGGVLFYRIPPASARVA